MTRTSREAMMIVVLSHNVTGSSLLPIDSLPSLSRSFQQVLVEEPHWTFFKWKVERLGRDDLGSFFLKTYQSQAGGIVLYRALIQCYREQGKGEDCSRSVTRYDRAEGVIGKTMIANSQLFSERSV